MTRALPALRGDSIHPGESDRDRMSAARLVDRWECPCGREPRTRGSSLTPVRTIVSLREPCCPFCGRAYREEYRRAA
jgi:hypothetical protein